MRFFILFTFLTLTFACKTPKTTTVTTVTTTTTTTTTESDTTTPVIHEYSGLYGEKNIKGLPIMHFEERTQHLGMVKKGEKRNLEFPFKNIGEGDLNISIITACECTSTNQDDLRSKTYKPGEGGVLKVTFDSSEKDYSELIDIEIILDQYYGPEEIPIIEKVYYDFDIEK